MKLNDVFPNWLYGEGIFSIMNDLNPLPFPFTDDLDTDFFGKYGQRLVSPLLKECFEKYNARVLNDNEKLLVDDSGMYVVSPQGLYRIAEILNRRFSTNWGKLYATMSLQYNPIENYSMTEQETNTNQKSGQESTTTSQTQTEESTGQTQGNGSGSATTYNEKYGFNSTEPVPTDNTNTVSTTSQSQSQSVERSNNIQNSGSNNIQESSNGDRVLTRSGNIGVTTSQQMIESERNVWLYDFYDVVYRQVVRILTIPYYD